MALVHGDHRGEVARLTGSSMRKWGAERTTYFFLIFPCSPLAFACFSSVHVKEEKGGENLLRSWHSSLCFQARELFQFCQASFLLALQGCPGSTRNLFCLPFLLRFTSWALLLACLSQYCLLPPVSLCPFGDVFCTSA